jgi:hypothetical protein
MRACRFAILAIGLATPLRAQASLTGYVRDETSLKGMPGVEVSAEGADRKTRTDKEGRYALRDLPSGKVRIVVRLVGFVPIDTTIEFAGKPAQAVFFLTKAPVVLDTVSTNARQRGLPGAGFDAFEERRSRGIGKFLDSTFLRANEHRQVGDILRGLGGFDIATPSSCRPSHPVFCDWRVAVSRRGQALCTMEILMDGSRLGRSVMIDDRDAPPFSPPAVVQAYAEAKDQAWSKAFNINTISIGSLRGVEVYRSASEAPGMYAGGDTGGCGLILLWTRR